MHLRFEAISADAGGYSLVLKYIFLAGFSAKILCFLGTVWRFSVLIRIVLLIDSRISCFGIVCLSQDLHMNFKITSFWTKFYFLLCCLENRLYQPSLFLVYARLISVYSNVLCGGIKIKINCVFKEPG